MPIDGGRGVPTPLSPRPLPAFSPAREWLALLRCASRSLCAASTSPKKQSVASDGAAIAVLPDRRLASIYWNFLPDRWAFGPGEQLQCLSMKCPGCSTEMTPMTLDARLGGQVAIDVCARCHPPSLHHFASLNLSPGST